MISKIKVHPFVGDAKVYLVVHNKESGELHMALTAMFNTEYKTLFAISYIQSTESNDYCINSTEKIDRLIVLE